ncbi:barstar family protein [Nocardia asteroides]|uniref:barstar family protein n=1 Tax=Nocardia asteroides TaxID=1824 RepID=UPI003F549E49
MNNENTATPVATEWNYALYVEDQDSTLAYCSDIENFFTDSHQNTARTQLILRKAKLSPSHSKKTFRPNPVKPAGNGEIRILSRNRDIIGSYYVSDIVITPIDTVISESVDLFDIPIVCNVLTPPSAVERPLWNMRREGGPKVLNTWQTLSDVDLYSWIRVAQVYQLHNPAPTSPPGTTFFIDGQGIENVPGLFCALGEAVNGPGGYFGMGLESLADCLHGGFGASAPFSISWSGWHHMASAVGNSYCTDLADVLTAGSVTLQVQ